jgi:hypothetical protein
METCRLTDDLSGLRLCLGNLGALCNVQCKPNEALAYLRKEESICRQYRDDEALHLCLGNQAESQKLLANYDAALDLLEEKVRICHKLGKHFGEAHAMLQKAHLFGEDLRAIGMDVLICRITSVLYSGHLDVELRDWSLAGLEKPSVARLTGWLRPRSRY